MNANLESELLAAHESRDVDAIISLYAVAAERSEDSEREAFFLTHAWVFALEAGDPRAPEFHRRLRELGRAD